MSKNYSFKTAILTSIGSAIGYYNFVIYILMSKYVADAIFDGDDFSHLKTFLVFASGYAIRPFSGFIFGSIGDIYGRKSVFIFITMTMALSSLGIGVLPTYAEIGIFSPIMLISLRLLQGISFGAEIPGAAVMVKESGNDKLGRLSSLITSSAAIGFLLANLVITLLNQMFDKIEIEDGMWRAPFIFGGILAIFSQYVRKSLRETDDFLKQSNKLESPFKCIISLLRNYKGSLFLAIGLTIFHSFLIITNLYFISSHLVSHFSYSYLEIHPIMILATLFSAILTVGFGFLADKYGKMICCVMGIVGILITIHPSMKLLDYGNIWVLIVFLLNLQIWLSLYLAGYMPILSSIFDINTRYSGTIISYNFSFLICSFMPVIYTIIEAKYSFYSRFTIANFFFLSCSISAICLFLLFKSNKKQIL